MGALRAIGIRISLAPALAMALTMATPAAAGPPTGQNSLDRWRPYVEEASRRFDVPVAWIERVMLAESGGRTELGGRAIVSHAGAMGLMQLMPGTWADMRRRLGLGTDPHAPRDNILAGTLYLRLMHDRFGYPGLFGAYNAGPARYAAFLDGRQKLPGETRTYLRKVAGGAADPARAAPFVRAAPSTGAGNSGGAVEENAPALFFIRRHLPGARRAVPED